MGGWKGAGVALAEDGGLGLDKAPAAWPRSLVEDFQLIQFLGIHNTPLPMAS